MSITRINTIVPVFSYVQDGAKMKKIRTGSAELIPLERQTFPQTTTMSYESCGACGKRSDCNLRLDSKDLCPGAFPVIKGQIVLNGAVLPVRRLPHKITTRNHAATQNIQDILLSRKVGRVKLTAKVTRDWTARHDKIVQGGILSDETGNIPFVIWDEAGIPPLEWDKSYDFCANITVFNGTMQISFDSLEDTAKVSDYFVLAKHETVKQKVSVLTDSIIPEKSRCAPGFETMVAIPAEMYSATPFIAQGDDAPYWKKELDPDELSKGGLITRKMKANQRAKVAEKKIKDFRINRGSRLQDKLRNLLKKDRKLAEATAKRLSIEDWKCLNAVGGIPNV